jgi:hypothetical protein
LDDHSDLDPGSGTGPFPISDLSGEHPDAPGPAGGRGSADAPAAGEVAVPVWALPPAERAALLRIVRAGGKAQHAGPARDQITELLRTGYLAPYDEGAVILTPAALRAIAAEVDRRASAAEQRPAQAAGDDRAEGPRS